MAFDPFTADLDDPGTKLAIRGQRAGGTITGSPGGSGTLSGGGGGVLGVSSALTGGAGEAAALRALIRKRQLAARGVPYQPTPAAPTAAPAPAPAADSLMGMPTGGSSWLQKLSGGGGIVGAANGNGVPKDANGLPVDVNFGKGLEGTINGILREFLGTGAFGNKPNPAVMDLVRSKALLDAQGLRDHNALAAQALGADPATAASYALRSDLQSQGGVARALSDATLQQSSQAEDFGRQLLLALLGAKLERNGQRSGGGADLGGLASGVGTILAGLSGL